MADSVTGSVRLQAGDEFFTRGLSWVSNFICMFTQSITEKRSQINHVGLIIETGDLQTAVGVEAIHHVVRRTVWSAYGPPCNGLFAVYRARNLTDSDVSTIVARAQGMVGRRYGFFAIVVHLLDWFLMGLYLFRRLVKDGRYPICSWLVADAFSSVGKHFACEPGAAQPDGIWDYVNSAKHDHYDRVYPLKPLR